MTCPACDYEPLLRKRKIYFCTDCRLSFKDPVLTVGIEKFAALKRQHARAVVDDIPSAIIRRGWQIEDPNAQKLRLLTWIEIGAITGAI